MVRTLHTAGVKFGAPLQLVLRTGFPCAERYVKSSGLGPSGKRQVFEANHTIPSNTFVLSVLV